MGRKAFFNHSRILRLSLDSNLSKILFAPSLVSASFRGSSSSMPSPPVSSGSPAASAVGDSGTVGRGLRQEPRKGSENEPGSWRPTCLGAAETSEQAPRTACPEGEPSLLPPLSPQFSGCCHRPFSVEEGGASQYCVSSHPHSCWLYGSGCWRLFFALRRFAPPRLRCFFSEAATSVRTCGCVRPSNDRSFSNAPGMVSGLDQMKGHMAGSK
mmetsp:Transcript_29559/g.52914  ORF Transcript_29559/g.52914 Transcript_29559/m.52914 type:complete len:212 (+) Transcript_29559:874-1509(+)